MKNMISSFFTKLITKSLINSEVQFVTKAELEDFRENQKADLLETIRFSNFGERQFAKSVNDIAPDHRNRYIFASQHLSNKSQVLDIACGIGYGSCIMANASKETRFHAADLDPFAIIAARRYYSHDRVNYQVANLHKLPSEWQEKFDLAVSFETLEHLTSPKAALLELKNTLRPGAKFLVSTPNQTIRPFDITDTPFHIRHYTADELTNLLTDVGFKMEAMYCQKSRVESEVVEGQNGYCLIALCRKAE